MNSFKSHNDPGQLDRNLALYVCHALRAELESSGSATLAVSGGKTPIGFFHCLSLCDLDWRNISVALVDERWVETSSPESNENLLRNHLVKNKAADTLLVGLKTNHDRAEDGLRESQQRISLLDKPFAAVVLGMGTDGHTASWFPGADNLETLLDRANTAEVAITEPVTANYMRVTLTLPAVLNSREIIVHATGDTKRAVLESASERRLPIATVLEQRETPVSIWWAPDTAG